uniref:Uncharacterized protein n=1 Tax=Kwoniella pini CBS 10737 TaxID=1296096 RepID=A0A1B9I8F8_9TREE|nr:uncharacterized protein I206_02515 [Kwoniella pini CBS 10737]OCF51799.1 hypothetical protein I206_02515 [Kwoniella pini CBS 10737]
MSISRPLLASNYSSIEKRGEKIDIVKKELNHIINALPTQIHPIERELYLEAILNDLNDEDDAPWKIWSQDVYLLALTAIKSLGRNPVGSENLLSSNNFIILLYHSGLPFTSSFSSNHSTPALAPEPYSTTARETLKILANLLVLHEQGRNIFASSGGAKAISRALAGKDINEEEINHEKEEDYIERLFLLSRLGFLITINRPRAVSVMVDTEDVIDSLVNHLITIQPIPSNHMALSELLKLSNNIFRFYPYSQSSDHDSSKGDTDQWDQRFDPIPFIDLSPPLTHTIHALLSIPFLPRLLPIWHSIPIPSSPRVSSPNSSVKNLLNKLSSMSTHSNYNNKKTSTPSSSCEGLSPPNHRKTPSPLSSRRSSGSSSTNKPIIPPSHTQDPSALPTRLLRIFDHFFETYLPWPKKPDDTLPQGLVLDEMLPPLLLFLTQAATGSEHIRSYLKETLIPSTLDRSPEAGPLENRKGTLGNILRLMGCAGHLQSKNTAGELMWAICKGDAADLCVEIGYGNAAGLLFQKGLTSPPEAKIEEIPNNMNLSINSNFKNSINIDPATSTKFTQSNKIENERNPITGLSNLNLNSNEMKLNEMTEEEKEKEAEKLFILFERLEKNPIISIKSNDNNNNNENDENKKLNMMNLMKDKLNSGQFQEEDEKNEKIENKQRQEQDEKDEKDAIKEIENYKKRIGKK